MPQAWGRVEVPALPHNVRRFLNGTMSDQGEEERDNYRRSREVLGRR